MKSPLHRVACASFMALASASLPAGALEVGQPAADFEGATPGGKKLHFSSLKGKVVLLDFWASWCEPCKKEIPHLAAIAKRLRARGVEIVAVNLDNEKGKAEEFLTAAHVQLPVVLDPDGSITKKYDPQKMPTAFIIDKEGVIREINAGYEPGDEKKIEKKLVELATP